MIQISVNNLKKSFGVTTIFDNISFEIKKNDKIAIVGKNGCGKSTLLKMLIKEEEITSGSINVRKNLTLGYLEQSPSYPNISVREVLEKAFDHIYALESEMKKLEQNLNSDRKIKRYGQLQHKFERLKGYSTDSELRKISSGLNINFLDKRFDVLSGGEKTLVLLGKVLLEKPDILLLDEPTNHLDIKVLEWLEKYLNSYDGTIIIVSHDRYFINNVTNKIIELKFHEAVTYTGNYEDYKKQKKKNFELEIKRYKLQQKKIEKLKKQIKQYQIWSRGGQNEKFARKAKELQKRLEKINIIKKPLLDATKMKLDFKSLNKSSNDVIRVKNLTKKFNDKTIFKNLNYLLTKNERICIVGDNGSGKSTFIKMILGQEDITKGSIKIGPNVHYAYLSQLLHFDDENKTLIEYLLYNLEFSYEKSRSMLASFMFNDTDIKKQINQLSGGEKVRFKLCILMNKKINFLIMDEPTNHLDIYSKNILENSIKDFDGTILFISHDRYFINKIAEKIIEIDNYQFNAFLGNYSYYKEKKEMLSEKNSVIKKESPNKTTTLGSKEKTTDLSKNRSLYKKLKREMLVLEEKIDQIDNEIKENLTNHAKLNELYKEKAIIEKKYEKILEKILQ